MKMILNNLKIFYLFIIIFLFYSLAQAGIEDKDTVPIENTENPFELDEETTKSFSPTLS